METESREEWTNGNKKIPTFCSEHKEGEPQWRCHEIFQRNFRKILYHLIFPEEFRKLTTNCTQRQTPSEMKAKSAWKLADFYTAEIWKLQSHITSITETRKKSCFTHFYKDVLHLQTANIAEIKYHEIPLNWQGISFSCFQSFRWVSEALALKI